MDVDFSTRAVLKFILLSILFQLSLQGNKVDATKIGMIGNKIMVDDVPFHIRGLCYSPVPRGETPEVAPFGDYFTPEYAYIWKRDLPLIRSLGVNTLRIYGWNNTRDHTEFLNQVYANGLYIMITFYIGPSHLYQPNNAELRQNLAQQFLDQVSWYSMHPAVLMWSFGNELNGWWNGWIKDLSHEFNCGYTYSCVNNIATDNPCFIAMKCVYSHFFSWINGACKAASQVSSQLCLTGLADVDRMVGHYPEVDKVSAFSSIVPDIDLWALQLYRGASFGSYFRDFAAESNKSMLVTEYGVDAYNDPCGWPENNHDEYNCNNLPIDSPRKGGDSSRDGENYIGCDDNALPCHQPGDISQINFDIRLTKEIMDSYPIVAGGFIMAWMDEYWKNFATQSMCHEPCPVSEISYCRNHTSDHDIYGRNGKAGCGSHSHITCPNHDPSFPDLCGYFFPAAPDFYVNEAWFGVTVPESCSGVQDIYGGHRLHTIQPRIIFQRLRSLWGETMNYSEKILTCNDLLPCYYCIRNHTVNNTLLSSKAFCNISCDSGNQSRIDQNASYQKPSFHSTSFQSTSFQSMSSRSTSFQSTSFQSTSFQNRSFQSTAENQSTTDQSTTDQSTTDQSTTYQSTTDQSTKSRSSDEKSSSSNKKPDSAKRKKPKLSMAIIIAIAVLICAFIGMCCFATKKNQYSYGRTNIQGKSVQEGSTYGGSVQSYQRLSV